MATLLVARRGDPVKIEAVSDPADPDGDLYERCPRCPARTPFSPTRHSRSGSTPPPDMPQELVGILV
jgi:hypothetical protein